MSLTIIVLLGLFFYFWYRRRLYQLSLFKRLGIPGPEPSIFTGNLKEILNKGVANCQVEWTKKYGNLVGYYIGMTPLILVLDKELMNKMQIKDSLNFNEREAITDTAGIPDIRMKTSLPLVSGEVWKKMRSVLTPAFSTAKLKQILYLFEVNTDSFISDLSKLDLTKDIEMSNKISLLTTDTILTSALGVKTDVQHNLNDKIFLSIKKIFDPKFSTLAVLLIVSLPELAQVFFKFDKLNDWISENIFDKPSVAYSFKRCQEAIDMRRQGNHAQKDLLQLMLNANKESASNDGHMDDDTVISNAIIIVGAGNETVSSLLSFTCHLLAHYPDIQDKLRDEIVKKIDQNKPSYEDLSELKYMDQVLNESLRYFPPSLTAITRKNKTAFTYKNINFPTQCAFQVPIQALHRCPEYWPEADKFDPERFSAERKGEIDNLFYQPFGYGPRNCIGMRYAMTQAKYIMARIIQNFKILKGLRTEKLNLEIEDKMFTVQPKNGIWVKLQKL